MALPSSIVVYSKDENLCYVRKAGELQGFLKLNGNGIEDPNTRLELVPAEVGNGLVHIKCRYNNKYWVRSSPEENWIVAKADKPEEDESEWNCTLFKIVLREGDSKSIQFFHIQLQCYAGLWSRDDPYNNCLCAAREDCRSDEFEYIDCRDLFILPSYVAFKAANGKYLDITQELKPVADNIEAGVEFVVYTRCDGSIYINSRRESLYWLYPDEETRKLRVTPSEEDMKIGVMPNFWPVKIDRNVIALKRDGYFCQVKDSGVYLDLHDITSAAKLEVEDLVINREISEVEFRLNDARICDETDIEFDTVEFSNESDEPCQTTLEFRKQETWSKTWDTCFTMKLGVNTSLQSGIPSITGEGKVEISGQVEGKYEWGETLEEIQETKVYHDVTVKPMKKVKSTLMATKAIFEVPFSYSYSDSFRNEETIGSIIDDGMYTGINFFNFRYEDREEDL